MLRVELFLKMEQIAFPCLESLTIEDNHPINTIDMSFGMVYPSYIVPVWGNTPCLRELSLGVNIPLSANDAHTTLQLCTGVVSLKITLGVLGNEHEMPVDEPVNLPFLTRLTIEFYSRGTGKKAWHGVQRRAEAR
ncbi:hypothetical protein BDZ94DRAFT_1242371 [Collybia nuda]|uniref:Uncharacterized protein n=1 Tax=Collybia nuda TaxID=64659 RepID=A0A9P5XPM3_9AGAR|nr:hypothetical protein BDZ94DRAFT_1242371 [Collybia nuda]